jgi:hypothetical protein
MPTGQGFSKSAKIPEFTSIVAENGALQGSQ